MFPDEQKSGWISRNTKMNICYTLAAFKSRWYSKDALENLGKTFLPLYCIDSVIFLHLKLSAEVKFCVLKANCCLSAE